MFEETDEFVRLMMMNGLHQAICPLPSMVPMLSLQILMKKLWKITAHTLLQGQDMNDVLSTIFYLVYFVMELQNVKWFGTAEVEYSSINTLLLVQK